jgi:cytoskeletal protein CcmA (bactofilin family)
MSIFKQPPMPNERPPVRLDTPSSSAPDTGASVIAAAMKIVGDVETSGVLKVDGTVQGAIRGARQVILGRTGVIEGDVHAEEAILGGRMVGTVNATERVEIQANSLIEGDIHTRSIVVIEGGILNGNVRMDSGGKGAAASTQGGKGGAASAQVTPIKSPSAAASS